MSHADDGEDLGNTSMRFCPVDGTLLLYEDSGMGLSFFCQTCPYVHIVQSKFKYAMKLTPKAVGLLLLLRSFQRTYVVFESNNNTCQIILPACFLVIFSRTKFWVAKMHGKMLINVKQFVRSAIMAWLIIA